MITAMLHSCCIPGQTLLVEAAPAIDAAFPDICLKKSHRPFFWELFLERLSYLDATTFDDELDGGCIG